MIPVLQKFLCCMSLRKGAIILAIVSIVTSLITVVKQSIGLVILQDDEFMGEFKLKMYLRNPDWGKTEMNDLIARIKLMHEMNLAMAVIVIICAALLIYGAQKNRRFFIIPYLICSGVVVLYLGFFCGNFIYLAFNPTEGPDSSLVAAVAAFCYFVALVVQVYLWLCVYSLFQWIREQEILAQQRNNNPGVTYTPVAKNV